MVNQQKQHEETNMLWHGQPLEKDHVRGMP